MEKYWLGISQGDPYLIFLNYKSSGDVRISLQKLYHIQ